MYKQMKNLSRKANELRDLPRNLQLLQLQVLVYHRDPMKTKVLQERKGGCPRGKGIDLLSEVALAEKAQLKEVRKNNLRGFHKTHPSGSGTVAEKPLSFKKITPTVTSKGTSDKSGVPDVTEDDSTESESESWDNNEEAAT
ncbi:hypothetical protein Tco_0535829 [Tanacetum coccineum]